MTSTPYGPEDLYPSHIAKVTTGIKGLDQVLHGGLPAGALSLISGGPGTGKTMLGLEFLVRGARAGAPGILLTFEEREEDLRTYGRAFGWDLAQLEAEGKLALICARIPPDAVLAGDFDLRGILAILRQRVDALRAERIMIDAPDAFLRLLDSLAKERAELHILHEWLRDAGLTALMTVKARSNEAFAANYDFLEYVANCVIQLDQRVSEQITTRRLRIVKYRGSSFGRNEYPFGITPDGTWIIPVTQTNLRHRALGEPLSSGVPGLDALVSGGYRRSSCTLITGSSGTGKTTFAASYVRSITAAGERLLYLDFEESWDALLSCMSSAGIDLRSARASGHLQFHSRMPESQGIEEHLMEAFRLIEAFEPQHLIVDAISACRRMGSAHAAFDYLLRLVGHCKERGMTSLLTNLTAASRDPVQELTGIDLSSVIDTVIVLRNIEVQGRYRRELIVLKSRGRAHSTRVHRFHITGDGIVIERGARDGE